MGVFMFLISQLHQVFCCNLLKNPIASKLQSFLYKKQHLWTVIQFAFGITMTAYLVLTTGYLIFEKVLDFLHYFYVLILSLFVEAKHKLYFCLHNRKYIACAML